MHYLVHNSNLVTVAVMCLVHASLLIFMLIAGVTPLVRFNVLSVVVYSFCYLLCKNGHTMPVFVSILIEVSVYSAVATYYIGLHCGTFCFLFSIVPIIVFFGCFLFKGVMRWHIVGMLIINFGLYAFLFIKFDAADPVYVIAPTLRTIHVLFAMFTMVFATIFYSVIYIYASEVERSGLEQENKQLSADASEDALTGLLNRRGFLPVMKKLMENEMTSHFCISFSDIDNFKRINDSYGHDAGDEVLRHITGIIKREMQGCYICRWGGEEIIILMKDYDFAVAKEKMKYVRKSIENSPTVFFNQRIPATITIGLEENKPEYKEPDDIIKIADERMYYGKQHGKNIVISEGGNVA